MWPSLMQDSLLGPAVSGFGFGATLFSIFFLVMALWSLAWKALGLWYAARNRQRIWFVVLLVFPDTVGILPIAYLAWFRKNNNVKGDEELFPFLSKLADKIMPEKDAASPAPRKRRKKKAEPETASSESEAKESE